MRMNTRKAFAVIAATGILLAACGDDAEETTETEAPAATEAPATDETEAPAATEAPATDETEAPAATEAPAEGDDPLAALYQECLDNGAKVNLIALPDEWANYKGILAAFGEKYPGVEYPVASPDASSAEEMEAVETLAGQDDMPDNVDVSPAIAQEMVDKGLFEPYVLTTDSEIPDGLKDARQQLDRRLLRHHGDQHQHDHRPERPDELRRSHQARVQGPREPQRRPA